MTQFNIEIKNCNNIDSGNIIIFEAKLNIKFGVNGTGKSTIAKALKYRIDSPEKLKELTPFKVKNESNSKTKPDLVIPENIKSVMIFNEEYLSQFIYKEDELISNSFEIFIKSQNYIKSAENIDSILEGIKKVFSENQELHQIINDFESLSKSFIATQKGLSKKSAIYKALKDGNKQENIPESLKGYTPFLKDNTCTNWLDWQIKGEQFIDISDDCPYCTSLITDKKETIKSVSKTYDKNIIKNFTAIIESIKNLGDYFSEEAKTTLETITKKHTGLEDSEMNYIVVIKQQIDDLLVKLKALKEISTKSFREDEKVEEKIKTLKIDLNFFDRFKSEKSKKIIESLNLSLDEVLKKIGELQGEVNKQRIEVKNLIKKYQISINQFLKKAGYKYEVLITDNDGEDYKLRLKHIESDERISRGNQYLSFGEKNAFALVLFMYEALSKKSDLIILDDPISSFDKNKKYAIMDMLFREDNSFKGKTVLMLTHDIEPIIDSVKVLHKKFGNQTSSYFINTKNNQIQELEIKKDDLLSFSQICNQIVSSSNINEVVKIIYLRRYYESIDDKSNEYEVLSNLLHKRSKDESTDQRKNKIEGKYQKLLDKDFENGVSNIKAKISSFDYNSLLNTFKDNTQITKIYNETEDSFAKIILFRILIDGLEESKKPDDVFMKFINEIYHIENDFLFQLNPEKFNITPQFIIEGCDTFVKSIEDNN